MKDNSEHLKLSYSYTKSIDGGYVGFINEVHGVLAQGETLPDLKYNLHSALMAMFKFNKEIGNPSISSVPNDWSTRKMAICI